MLLVAAAKAKKEGKVLGSLIAKLGQPAEAKEYRIKIKGEEDFRGYGENVLKTFEERARKEGIRIAEPSYEGVRLVLDDGWALIRLSLHDPNMPVNVESRHAGGVAKISAKVVELLDGFASLDLSVFK